MKPLWRIADLIDLEYLLLLDDAVIEEEGQDALRRRDRDIYLHLIESKDEAEEELNPPLLLNRWLKSRQKKLKEQDDGAPLPGKLWSELYGFFRWGLLLLGLISGTGLAFSFLAYSGSAPVNISVYLGLFVGVQVLLLALFGAASLYRLLLRLDLHSSVLYVLLSRLTVRVMLKIRGYAGNKLNVRQRLQMASAMGLVREKTHAHGSLFLWPMLSLIQVLALGFNVGVLAATLLKVMGADIAFGWQSTLQVSEQFVFTLVQSIALPWSWFVPVNIAYPSLAQIEGSQMVLKEGIYHLATQDLISWWPFLCLAVLFYGLLPRLALFFVGLGGERRSLARLQFRRTAHRQLLQRMTTQQVSTQAPGQNPYHAPVQEAEPVHLKTPLAPKTPLPIKPPQPKEKEKPQIFVPEDQVSPHSAVTLIPDELYDQCPLNTLQGLVLERLGVTVHATLRTGEEYADDQLIFDQLAEKNRKSTIKNIIILQEAWQPPIQEFFSFLGKLRTLMGSDVPLVVALVGKPGSNTIFTPVKKEDLNIWRDNIRALGYPDLQVSELVAA